MKNGVKNRSIGQKIDNFFHLPNDFVGLNYMSDMSGSEVKVYLVLRRYSNSGADTAYPSYETIKKHTGLGKTAVAAAIKSLERKRYISKLRKGSQNSGSNQYKVNDLRHIKPILTTQPTERGNKDNIIVAAQLMTIEHEETCLAEVVQDGDDEHRFVIETEVIPNASMNSIYEIMETKQYHWEFNHQLRNLKARDETLGAWVALRAGVELTAALEEEATHALYALLIGKSKAVASACLFSLSKEERKCILETNLFHLAWSAGLN